MRLFVTPARNAAWWRVLRRTADVFTGPDDSGAVVVADDCTDNCLLDLKAVVNGTPYFYRYFAWTGAGWDSSAPSVAVTPGATYRGDAIDPVSVLRDRLEAGLAVEVARGALLPQSGSIPVLKSPFILSDQIVFPTVFVHLDTFAPADRFLGDDGLSPLHDDVDGGWTEFEGFLARNQINIGAVSRLPDERNALRRALVRVLQANLPVFAAAGLNLVEFSFGDSEQLQENAAPLFLTGGGFTCVAHSFVADAVPEIAAVNVNQSYSGMEPP